ncbi:MAG TPA: hypothetical protein VM822_17950 [Pseudolabrys sp.]|jgi:hypothetical protein|nr:hypothetical protein [Pseudolabrys sp.]
MIFDFFASVDPLIDVLVKNLIPGLRLTQLRKRVRLLRLSIHRLTPSHREITEGVSGV